MRLPQPARTRIAGLLGLLATLGGGAGCLAPAKAEALVATGFRSPQQTLSSFQTFVRADLPTREYQCFSLGFRERNGLSALSYGEVREELFRSQPWLKWIAKADVVGEKASGAAEHGVDLETLGRTVRVKLVREDFYGIHAGEKLVTDGDADFDALVRSSARGDGSRLDVRLPLDDVSEAQLAGATEVLVARHWKIDDVRVLSEDEARYETAAP
jgi:hypothetical protein